MNIGIIGAGVVGLTTGLELQKEFPGANISIIAGKFNEETTSDGAAGLFRPGTSFSGPTEYVTRKWIKDAYEYWDDLRLTLEASRAGIAQVSGYLFSSKHRDIVENSYIDKLVPVYKAATEDELKLCPGNWKYGTFFTTLLIECRLHLPWASQKFLTNDGKIIKRTIYNFHNLKTYNFDIIFNCTGLGARNLCNDKQLVPMRGQVLKVHAPWIKTFFYGDYDTYIIPGFNAVTLGGTRQFDSYNTEVCRHDSASIRERCEALVPSLKKAKVLREWVGLRPHRAIVRVEQEIIKDDYRNMKIIHNYGHGGYGVTTAPGTSKHAVQLAKEFWMGNSKI